MTKTSGAIASSKSSAFTYVPATGLLKSETIEPGNALSVTKTYNHDGFGNITSTSVTGSGITRSGSSVYDPTGRFLIGESNQLGHTLSYSYDFNRAVLLSTSDIARKTTRFGYDALGTLVRTYHPDSTQTGESTSYYAGTLPVTVSANVTNPIFYVRAKQTSGAPTAKVYLDQSGRDVVSETTILRDANASSPSARYSQVYTVTQYDSLGRKTKVSDAFGASEIPKFTEIFYDVVGRVNKTIHPDGAVDQALAYYTDNLAGQPVSRSISQNSKSGVLQRWEDQHGRFIQSLDTSGQTTTFHHDLEGRLTSVKIDGVTMLTNTFDTFGNKTSVTEANSGISSSTFNAFGEVLSSTNAKNQVTSFTYDAMGRPLTVTKPEGTFTTYYDGASGSGLGKPWKTIGPAGYQELISYDDMGRPRNSSKTQFGETFTSSTTYDALSRVVSETDAGGLTVIHGYDPLYSFPTKLSIGLGSPGAGTVLWQAGTFDAKGRPLTQTLAQGVSTSASYHPLSGLLTGLNASAGGNPLQAKSYTWDSLGNLTTRTDDLMKRSETFGYDIQNRVTSTSFASLSGATTTTLPPPDSYTYTTNGNLLTKGQATLKYEGTRPHAVTSAVIKGAARTYAYDAAGYVESDSKRTYTWTSFGQLLSLDYLAAPALQNFAGGQIFAASRVQTDFSFDAGGNRARQLKQRLNSDSSSLVEGTTYLGSYERERHSTKSAPAAPMVLTRTVHRHSIGGFAVYTRTDKPGLPSETKLTTILKDHLGSTDLLYTGTWTGSGFSTPTPASIERQSFDPWGERRAPDTLVSYRTTDTDTFRSSAQDYDRGYTGHEQLDDSGLIHMNGRIYDPELGRMLSPDPFVQVPEYSQNFNRYSYVMNNPLNMTDPSGFSWLSKAFKKIGNWLSENWRTIVIIVVVAVITFVSGGLASAWATAMGFSNAVSAAIGAGVGAFWGSAVRSLLSGQSIADSFKGALKDGLIAAATAFVTNVGLEKLVDATNPNQDAKLYKIDGKTGQRTLLDPSEIKEASLRGKVFVNGMNNDLQRAIDNGISRVGSGKDFYLVHNPTNGGLADFLECGLDKLGGQSKISTSTAKMFAKFDPSQTAILAHSQGTMISVNALNILSKTQSVRGFTLNSWGSAQNALTANLLLKPMGIDVGSPVNHPFDPVANIVGFNALTKPNPYRFIGSLIASPLIFQNEQISPHSLPQGGRYLRNFPWLYDN